MSRPFQHTIFFTPCYICSLLFSLHALAFQSPPPQKVSPHLQINQAILPDGTRSALIIAPIEKQQGISKGKGQIIEQQNGKALMAPASTLKLFTALAAKLELGDDFSYQTRLEQRGDDLIVRFSGDPSLSYNDLTELFTQAGISKIRGDVIFDNHAFTGYQKGVGWPWDIVGICYSTVSSAIVLDNNCVRSSIYTNANGSTRAFVPSFQPITLTTTAKSVTKAQQKHQFCDLELAYNDNNQYKLAGCLVTQDKPLPLNFAIQNPYLYTKARLEAFFQQQEINLNGEIRLAEKTVPKGKLLAQHNSATLPILLDHMLKKSDNLYANNLTKTLGAHHFKQAGSFTNGVAAIKAILQQKAGIDLSSAVLEDGSGLSRNNRITAQQLYRLLNYVAKNDKPLDFIRLLPTAGVDGTLQYRASMRKAPIKGRIIAKSGSLFATHNMAGFVLDKNGQPKAIFVQLINDYHLQNNTNLVSPLTQFEQGFYGYLIQLVDR